MKASNNEQFEFEPSLIGAVRRYWAMVMAIVFLTTAAAVVYTLKQPPVYQATATVTVPQPLLAQGQGSDQYLDSQVLLLESPAVASQAAHIANATLGFRVLADRDFSGDHKALEISPPEGATPGSYGATIITATFTWPDARVAQVGANSLMRAFDNVRTATIRAQGQATVNGIQAAIGQATSQGQRSRLQSQRTQALVNRQVDLAHHPTVSWAVEPQVPVNGNVVKMAAIGLLFGLMLGAGLAYARANRRRCFDDRQEPATLYDAPLIGEIPASLTGRTSGGRLLPMSADPHSSVAEAFRFTAGSVERIRAARGSRLSLTFVSSVTGVRRSAVMANVALAIAESGTRVLAVDADAGGELTSLLLPDHVLTDGFQQVLTGQRAARECIQRSPFHRNVAVLASGPHPAHRVTGTAYSKAVHSMLDEAKEMFDIVLVDSPALLRMADATELVAASDSAIVVLGPDEPIREHLDMADRLELVDCDVVGYIYTRAPKQSWPSARRREGRSARAAHPVNPPILAPSPVSDGPRLADDGVIPAVPIRRQG